MTTERWQELVLGAAALVWGVALMFPGDLFRGIKRYADLVAALPDWAWGLLLIVCGVLILPLTPLRLRKEAHAGLGVLWSLIVVLLFLDGFSLPSLLIGALCAAPALLHFFRYLQLSQLSKL